MSGFDSVSIYTKLITAGTSACIADAVTFPLDTAKVRLQVIKKTTFSLQTKLIPSSRYKGRCQESLKMASASCEQRL